MRVGRSRCQFLRFDPRIHGLTVLIVRAGAFRGDGFLDRLDCLVGAEIDDFLRQFRRLLAVRNREAVDRRFVGLHALVKADALRIIDEHVERDDRIVVQVV